MRSDVIPSPRQPMRAIEQKNTEHSVGGQFRAPRTHVAANASERPFGASGGMACAPNIAATLRSLLSEIEEPISTELVADGVERWLVEHVEQRCKPTTRAQYRDAVRPLAAVLGHMPLAMLQPSDVRALLATISEGQVSAVFSAWSSCLRWLGGGHAVEGIRRPKSRRREGFLDTHDLPHWMAALAMATQERWARRRTLHCLTALTLVPMRIGEMVRLSWAEVDLGSRLVRLRDSKTGPRMVPLGKLGASILAAQPRSSDFVWTPPRESASGHIGKTGVSKACTKVLRRYSERTGHRFHPEMCAHALRHTWATHAGSSGEKDKHIQQICGWSTAWMQDRYSHQLARELGEATDRVQGRLVHGLQMQLEIGVS